MSAPLTVRYPSGATEFRMSDEAPAIGDTLKRNGDNWIVEDVTDADDGTSVVTLRSQPKPVRMDDDPTVWPDASPLPGENQQ
jgi:hypothetical protein